MATGKIQLRSIRNFNQNLSDTFTFFKTEFRPFMGAYIYITAIPMMIAAVGYSMYIKNIMGMYSASFSRLSGNRTYTQRYDISNALDSVSILGGLIALLALFAFTVLSRLSVAGYMKLYNKNNGASPTRQAVWEEVKKHLGLGIGITFASVVLIILGALFCLIPAIYVGVSLAFYANIIVEEDNQSFTQVLNRCFALIKDNFWNSLGLYFIINIIISIIGSVVGSVFTVPSLILGMLQKNSFTPLIIIFSALSTLLGYLLQAIPIICYGLNYYSITEIKEGTGMMQQIEDINNPSQHDTDDENEERY